VHFVEIKLENFRGYESLEWKPAAGVNVIVGPNGTGKTNLVEAVSFLCLTKGFHAEKEALRVGEKYFMLRGKVEGEESFCVECNYLAGKGKKILHDGEKLERLSAHVGRIPLVTCLPEDVALVNEGGSERRKWVDVMLCQADASYLRELSRYEKALEGRNALLTAEREGGNVDADTMEFLTETLMLSGVKIQTVRTAFVEEFASDFADGYRCVAGTDENCALEYAPAVKAPDIATWRRESERQRRAESALGRTMFGIHRDDWRFFIDDKPAKAYGSQGQRKTFVLALKFAQYLFLERKTGRKPIFILDDVFDKLDPERVAAAADYIAHRFNGQSFVTDADVDRARRAFSHAHFFSTENGNFHLL
jgi:DNA replication and repair protein RecF